MNKPTLALTATLVGQAVLIMGCEQVTNLLSGGPRESLVAYLDATIRGESEAAYGYISAQDQEIRTLAAYKPKANNALAKSVGSKTTYSIISMEEHGDVATAQVEITMPDPSSLFMEAMGNAFASAFSGDDNENLQNDLAERIRTGELPTTTRREDFTLVREPEGWRIFLDWETEERVSALLSEAKKLKESKNLDAALEKYNQVLRLDSELIEAREGREETEGEIREFAERKKKFAEKQDYIGKVELYDLDARYYNTYLEKRVPGVEFKLKNKGDRTLDKVRVTVYFKAHDGSIIAEEDYIPVLVSTYSFSRENSPLKPNYIWQMERGKFYTAKSVPSEWKEGSISARITDIEFATE